MKATEAKLDWFLVRSDLVKLFRKMSGVHSLPNSFYASLKCPRDGARFVPARERHGQGISGRAANARSRPAAHRAGLRAAYPVVYI